MVIKDGVLTEVNDEDIELLNSNPEKFWQGVTSIGASAFNECENLRNIIIPSSITSIGIGAFIYCLNLKNVILPEGITEIKDDTFYCTSLESLKIPKSVKSIGNKAFYSCDLKKIEIPENIETIGDYAFAGCEFLKNITIHESVKNLGEGIFKKCKSLESIIIPKSVTSIGEYAFRGCDNLKSVKIPEGINISEDAFYGCVLLRKFLLYSKLSNNVLVVEYRDLFAFLKSNNNKVCQMSQSQFENIKKIAGENVTYFNLIDYFSLCSVIGAFESKDKTIELNQNGKNTSVLVKDVAYTFLQGAFKREELKMNEMHMYLQALKNEGYNEEFLKFVLNKTNFSELSGELTLLPRVYSWFLERTNLDINNAENQNQGLPVSEENRYRVLAYKTAENGIDRLKWLSPTLELLKKEFAERKFANITTQRDREIAEEVGKHSIYEQKHFDKAVEIDKERQESGVSDILDKKLSQSRIASLDEYRERTKQLSEQMLADSAEILERQLDDTSSVFTYETLEKSDTANFAIGCYTSCCATLYGAGAGAMRAMIIHPDIQPIAIRDFNGTIVSFGIIYVNREEGYAVVNDFEVSEYYQDKDDKRKAIFDKAIEGIETFIEEYNKQYSDRPIRKVTCGISPNWTALNDFVERNPKSEILSAPNFDDFKYAGSGSWKGDWHNSQYVIWQEENQSGKER